jgi:hypothetical protein
MQHFPFPKAREAFGVLPLPTADDQLFPALLGGWQNERYSGFAKRF